MTGDFGSLGVATVAIMPMAGMQHFGNIEGFRSLPGTL